ncbi:MAG: hypothetical protein IKV86_01905 [Clostridia bacterium]|nr:hypothetical protein [Clostridia bacterium]
MKKVLSMLLVLTLVVTTLMGTMVMEANAATDDKVTNYEITDNGSKITLRFGSKELPTSGLNAMNGFVLGDWYANGYTYSEEDIDAFYAGTATTIYGTPTPTVNFLSANVVEHPLADNIVKYDFKPVTIEDGLNAAKNYAVGKEKTWFGATGLITGETAHSANYSRISAFPLIDTAINKQDEIGDNNYSFSTITKDGAIATNTNSTAYVLSFYAYTQNVGSGVGQTIFFDIRSTSSGGFSLYSDDLVSTEGIPHKVDIVLSSDGTKLYKHYYVDGVEIRKGSSQSISGAVSFQPRFNINTFTGANGVSEPISDTDWYMPYYTSKTTFELVSQADLNNELIIVPNYTKVDRSATVRTDDYITGVIDSLDADIKAALETITPGDKIVEISEANYNNPASLFTGDASTVKLVSKTTGEEVAVADATGTMDDYYLMVNGIYIKVNKILPYYKSDVDPFTVSDSEHQQTVTRVYYENYEDNVMDESLPAVGGLRSGFMKYTATPRGNFSFYNGAIKYGTNDGYRFVPSPQIKLADHGDLAKKLTLKFDVYVPEYEATSTNYVRLLFSGHTDPTVTVTNSSGYGEDMQQIYFTTNNLNNGLTAGSMKKLVDMPGNAWNSVAIVFDSTDTAETGRYDISVYVNGELKLTYESPAAYAENAKERLCSLNFVRLYTPPYTSVAIMNDGWYAGNYPIATTPVAEGVIDADAVTGVEISVDEGDIIAYDNTNDADYSALIDAMSDAGYQPVYNQVIDIDLINEKYDEVDGLVTTVTNEDGTKTITGKLVKKWLDSPHTKTYVVADTSAEVSAYTIKNANITAAVDNGDGTASITITSKFGATGSYPGIASSYEEIIAALAAENPPREGRNLELTGFAVVEEGKLPKVYTLAENGMELRSLTYNKETAQAELTYREYCATAEDAYTFQLVVAAYNEDGKMLSLKIDTSKTITGEGPDGTNVVTFAPGFTEEVLAETAFYKVFAFETFVGGKAIISSAKVYK